MKSPLLLKFLGVLALLALCVGCESNAQFKESELISSGFKAFPAQTAKQQARLKTLSQTKMTRVQRNGVQYYVFPDVKHNVLYVGKQPQYNAYRNTKRTLLADREYQMGAENAFVSEDSFLTGFDDWVPFAMP